MGLYYRVLHWYEISARARVNLVISARARVNLVITVDWIVLNLCSYGTATTSKCTHWVPAFAVCMPYIMYIL